ncbi:hypothetical protein [Kitasatospora sp. NPDC127116]|uniref:hypothetical protein n=1 Tax=Kitasatospora sp. NPDC127116 TaxID=3345367 RepID=UPI0036457C5E
MYEQPPPQVPSIDRTQGYAACLKVIKEVVDADHGQKPTAPAFSTALGFTTGSPTARVDDTAEAGALQAETAIVLIMDGPGGFYGPSFADPAPWACDGAPTPGCLPPPPPAIGGFY